MTRSIRALALLALLAAAAIVAGAAAAPAAEIDDDAVSSGSIASGEEVELSLFSAYEYLAGEWDVYRHVITSSNSLSYAHSLPSVRWKLEKENGTASNNLVGSAWVNGTEGENAAIMLRVEMHEPSTGKIQTGVDEDHLNTLAQFQFSQMKGSIPVSVGVWNGAEVAGDAEGARYVLQASSHDRFTVLVTPSGGRSLAAVRTPAAAGTPAASKKRASAAEEEDDLHVEGPASTGFPALSASQLADGESFLYVFHRVRVEENKTFFQKYGTMMLLGCMLLVNVYMRSKSAAPTAAAAARRVAAPTPAAAASTLARNRAAAAAQGARIEEITEGSIEVNKKGQ